MQAEEIECENAPDLKVPIEDIDTECAVVDEKKVELQWTDFASEANFTQSALQACLARSKLERLKSESRTDNLQNALPLIKDFARNASYGEIDQFLFFLSHTSVKYEVSLLVAREYFKHSQELRYWHSFLKILESNLSSQNLDAKRLLGGLQ